MIVGRESQSGSPRLAEPGHASRLGPRVSRGCLCGSPPGLARSG